MPKHKEKAFPHHAGVAAGHFFFNPRANLKKIGQLINSLIAYVLF
jgi:hypothetical protein